MTRDPNVPNGVPNPLGIHDPKVWLNSDPYENWDLADLQLGFDISDNLPKNIGIQYIKFWIEQAKIAMLAQHMRI